MRCEVVAVGVRHDGVVHGGRGQRLVVRLLHQDPAPLEGLRVQAHLQGAGGLPMHLLPAQLALQGRNQAGPGRQEG